MKMYALVLILSCLLSHFPRLTADPWGKDADLALKQHANHNPSVSPHQLPVAEWLISFHQEVISPADGPRSHFKPSSSQYTLDAMRKYGFVQGYFLGCDRLMRENNEEWIYTTCTGDYGMLMKYDPVP